MGRLISCLALVLLVVFGSFAWSSEGRKLMLVKERALLSSKESSLFLSALPKGRVPSSSPSKKGHAEVVNEKLIARHLISMDRNLQSVPSPGVGH